MPQGEVAGCQAKGIPPAFWVFSPRLLDGLVSELAFRRVNVPRNAFLRISSQSLVGAVLENVEICDSFWPAAIRLLPCGRVG